MDTRLTSRLAAAGGFAYVFLAILGNDVVSKLGGAPDLTASRGEIRDYLATHPPTLRTWLGLDLELLGMLAFVAFAVALWRVLRRAEGEDGVLATTALASGLLALAVKFGSAAPSLALLYRTREGFDTQTAALAIDAGSFAFFLTWPLFGLMLTAAGVVAVRTGALPRVLAWSAAILGPALIASAAFAVDVPPFAFLLTLIWFAATSVYLAVRGLEPRRARAAAAVTA
jgi:hypothetical protein